MGIGPLTTERDLWQVWEQRLLPERLCTRDGYGVRVVFPGVPSAEAGPDFVDAQLLFDGQELVRGAVEMHLRASSWEAHGHDKDPHYNAVRLHVVLFDDGGPARTQQDCIVPVVALGPFLALEHAPAQSGVGLCLRPQAQRLAPEALRTVIIAAGEVRFAERVAAWEQAFAEHTAEFCVLQALLRAAGLGRNREACLALAQAVDGDIFAALLAAAGTAAPETAAAVLLGMAGLLEQGRADDRERRIWDSARRRFPARPLDPRCWQRFRVRPANLPEHRLRLIAALAARDGLQGFLDRCTALVRDKDAAPESLQALLCVAGRRAGYHWALEVWVSVLLPLIAAYGNVRDERTLATGAAAHHARLPGGGESRTLARMVMRCGLAKPPRAAIEQQGLLHIWRRYCSQQDCDHCPLMVPVAQ